MPKIKTKEAFTTRLNTYIKASKTAKSALLDCSQYALEHFTMHGDVGPAQRVYDAMDKNFARRGAFKQWFGAFAPVNMNNNEFFKDKERAVEMWAGDPAKDTTASKEAKESLVSAGNSKPFWDFIPEKEDVDWSVLNFQEDLNKLITRYEGPRYHAVNDDAKQALKDLKIFSEKLNKKAA